MRRRVGKVRAKPGQLRVAWGRMEPDDDPALCYAYGGGGAHRGDGNLVSYAFEGKRFAPTLRPPGYAEMASLVKELEARGYDIRTLKFSISKIADSDQKIPNR